MNLFMRKEVSKPTDTVTLQTRYRKKVERLGWSDQTEFG